MSYQVLARKYRPRIFREMVGQEHVLKALINALDHNRLHHAYLFTGTRGVGKTTIARILAKCLNCETGVSSEPCGECSACREIAEGRFVDLIEVDAASRTKVEDTRELLDNVQYAPTRGRYKIYLIDEVHMLSNHSFNALLKTLEEPPEHIKFLLATTDPQKLPVTILSRCLQFNLKNMNPERIVQHLQDVLGKEMVPFDEPGLWQLSRAADGSMRDALSLTDQAISYGGGKIAENEVSAMLGTIDHQLTQRLMQALVDSDGAQVLAVVAQFAEHAPDFQAALADLLTFLHRIAIAQALPEALDNSYGDRQQVMAFASQLPAEDVQLFYQTALIGRRDLPLSPNPRSGFEMTLLRMLAFRPQGVVDVPSAPLPTPGNGEPVPSLQATGPAGDASGNDASGAQEAPAERAAQASAPHHLPQSAEQSPDTERASAVPPASPIPGDEVPPVKKSQAEPHPSGVTGGEASAQAAVSEREAVLPDEGSSSEKYPAEGFASEKYPADEAPPWDDDDISAAEQFSGVEPGNEALVDTAEQRRGTQPQTTSAQGVAQSPSVSKAPPASEVPPAAQVAAVAEPTTHASPQMTAEPASPPTAPPVASPARPARAKLALDRLQPADWQQLFEDLNIKGLLSSTVANCVLAARQGNELFFALDENKGSLYDNSHNHRLADLISDYFGQPIKVHMDLAQLPADVETPAMYRERIMREKHAAALHTLQTDPVVQQLEREFGGQLREDSVTFID